MTATGLASSCQVRETVNRLRVPGVVYELSPQFPFAKRRGSVVAQVYPRDAAPLYLHYDSQDRHQPPVAVSALLKYERSLCLVERYVSEITNLSTVCVERALLGRSVLLLREKNATVHARTTHRITSLDPL